MFTGLFQQFKDKVLLPKIHEKMRDSGKAWVFEARRICPYDTGYMQSTIGMTYNQNTRELHLHVDAPYFLFVELGTRYMRAQPFARPALRAVSLFWGGFGGNVSFVGANVPEKYHARINAYVGNTGGNGDKFKVGHRKFK